MRSKFSRYGGDKKSALFIFFACLATIIAFSLQARAEELQAKVAKLHQSAGQSVVNITSKVMMPNIQNMPVPRKGTGSGFVYDDQGHIVTNYHVVQNASKIMISLSEDEMHEAKVVGSDPSTDLAVLKVEGAELPPALTIGNSDKLRVGQFVAAIGNSFGLRRTLTFGVISALGRVIHSPNGRFISEVLQTDAPINPGNSGGPLLDLEGKVVGVNTMILSPSGASSGVGFAVSSNTLSTICPVLIEKGKYPHPWLGIQTVNLNKGLIKFFEKAGATIPVDKGILVVNVFSESPAAKAGLQTGDQVFQTGMFQIPVGGDIIVAVEDRKIATYKDLVLYLEGNTDIGDTVEVSFYRDKKKMTKKMQVGERPKQMSIRKMTRPKQASQ